MNTPLRAAVVCFDHPGAAEATERARLAVESSRHAEQEKILMRHAILKARVAAAGVALEAQRERLAGELRERRAYIDALRIRQAAELDALESPLRAQLAKNALELAAKDEELRQVQMFDMKYLGIPRDACRLPREESPAALLTRYNQTSDPASRDLLREAHREKLEVALQAALQAEETAEKLK